MVAARSSDLHDVVGRQLFSDISAATRALVLAMGMAALFAFFPADRIIA